MVDSEIGAEGHKDLLDWLASELSGLSDFPDAVHLMKRAASAVAVTNPTSLTYI